MQQTYRRDDMTVTYLTIHRHGSPTKAVWFGRDAVLAAQYGRPVRITSIAGGQHWAVTFEDAQSGDIIVGPRTRVWLAPMPDQVLNPSPVPIRLASLDLAAYRLLSRALRAGADVVAADLENAAAPEEHRALIAVRDALRTAAVEALVPRGGIGTPTCRRCSAVCPNCTPASRCRNCGEPIEPVPSGATDYGDRLYRHKVTGLVGCGPDGVDVDGGHVAIAEPGGPR